MFLSETFTSFFAGFGKMAKLFTLLFDTARVFFIEKLEERLQESDKNQTIDEDQLKNEIQQWFTLNG